jgi:hypothetical protein
MAMIDAMDRNRHRTIVYRKLFLFIFLGAVGPLWVFHYFDHSDSNHTFDIISRVPIQLHNANNAAANLAEMVNERLLGWKRPNLLRNQRNL